MSGFVLVSRGARLPGRAKWGVMRRAGFKHTIGTRFAPPFGVAQITFHKPCPFHAGRLLDAFCESVRRSIVVLGSIANLATRRLALPAVNVPFARTAGPDFSYVGERRETSNVEKLKVRHDREA